MFRFTSRRFCTATAIAGESTAAKVKRLGKENATAFGIVYVVVQSAVFLSIYTMVCFGVDAAVIEGADRIAARLDYDTNFKKQLSETTAAKEGSRWAMTLAFYSVAPSAPITFPLYIVGTVALSKWAPFARRFGSKKV